MAIELAFRVGFFVVSLLLLFYSRTFLTSTAVLAVGAWLAYGHPESNSTGEEVLVFFITWVSATAVAAAIGSTINLTWMFELEWKLATRARSTLCIRDAVAWLLACAITAVAYTSTEVVGYDRGTFYRLQALALLLLLMLIVYFYDQVVRDEGYHLLPPSQEFRHKAVTLVIAVAVLIDILARDPEFWPYVVAPGLAWVALQALKLWLAPALKHPSERHSKRD